MFYAKSLKRAVGAEKSSAVAEVYLRLLNAAEGYLDSKERVVIENSLRKARQGGEKQKTLRDHLQEVVDCAVDFFGKYGIYFTPEEQKIIRFACRTHDWGKLNEMFQKKIGNPAYEGMRFPPDVVEIPHGYLSAYSITVSEYLSETEDRELKYFLPFLAAVYFHHVRQTKVSPEEFRDFFNTYYVKHLDAFLNRKNKIQVYATKILYSNKINSFSSKDPAAWDKWLKFVVIKGMLNKFDYTASAGYTEAELSPDLKEKRLKKAIEATLPVLRPPQRFMRQNSDRNVILVAGTGSGKTEAALLWLNGEKGFYTLPLQISSNAIYERIKNVYGYEDVAVLHGNSLIRYVEEDNGTDGYERYQQARNLSMPLTVCTVDQIFKFTYKAFGTELLAATLKYSKVIIDEIQAYSPQLIATLIYSLKIIDRLGGKYAIITATFPPVLQHFMEKYGIAKNRGSVYKDFASSSPRKRHWVRIRKNLAYEELVEQGRRKKVLIVCNTVKRAQEVYRELKKRTGDSCTKGECEVRLLHSRFIRKHRDMLERKIMEFSADKDATGIWVSTQIVEVSLDIDFDVLHTEICPCDSLLQRMGRCNRKERYEPKEANVFVYVKQDERRRSKIYDENIVKRSLDLLPGYENQLFTEAMKIEYVNAVYDPEKIQDTNYYKEIDKWLSHFEIVVPGEYDLQEVNDTFRMITSVSVMPDVIYDENVEFIEKALSFVHTHNIGSEAKDIVNSKLQELTVSVNIHDGKDKKWLGHKISVQVTNGSNNNRQKEFSGIYRCKYGYEFDETTLSGEGLIKSKDGESIDDQVL